MTESDILTLALQKWPNAAEIHVQFHTHVVGNQYGTTVEGLCRCSVEGSDVRRQFTAMTAVDLFSKVRNNQADDRDYTDLLEDEERATSPLSAASDLLWNATVPLDEPDEPPKR